MEIKHELKKNKVFVEMIFTDKEWVTAIDTAYKKNSSKYNVPGFRNGKAPRGIVEQQYGSEIFVDDAIRDLFTKNFEKFLDENRKIRLIDYPHLDFKMTKEGGLRLTAEVDVEPEVKLGKYTGLEIKKTEFTIGDKEIEEYLSRVRETRAKQIAAGKDHKVANGDIAVIDFKGSVNGKYFEGGEAKDYELEIGSKSFIDNFEEQLVGLKIGDNKDVNVTFPKDYHAENLKGAKAKFEVSVKNILRKELPLVDDQFVKEVSEFNTLAEYKADIKKRLQEHAEFEAQSIDEDRMFNTICDNASVEIPAVMTERHLQEIITEMEEKLNMQGMNLETYARYLNLTPDKLRERERKSAEHHVKLRMVLDAIAEKEGLYDKDRQKQFDKLDKFLKKNNKMI
jgi:trigger factor